MRETKKSPPIRLRRMQARYRQFKERMARAMHSGKFYTLRKKKQLQLKRRLERYARQLQNWTEQLPRVSKSSLATSLLVGTLLGGTMPRADAQTQNFTGPMDIGIGQIGTVPSNGVYVDIDDDGDLDFYGGYPGGSISTFGPYFKENIGTPNNAKFGPVQWRPFGIDVQGGNNYPVFADIDDDGDYDAFIMNGYFSRIELFENTGSAANPAFGNRQFNPFGFGFTGGVNAGDFKDLDGDGDLDLLVVSHSGFQYAENTGSATSPAFGAFQTNPFGLTQVAHPNPNLVDIDGDSDLDVMTKTTFFENTGTSNAPAFASAQVNPFGLIEIATYSNNMRYVDIDADNDLDAILTGWDVDGMLFENTGSSTSPAFDSDKWANPFGLPKAIDNNMATFVDIDKDGDADFFWGLEDGNISFLENTGSTSSPSFAMPQNNPFGLTDLGSNVYVEFADMDGDDDLDGFIIDNNKDVYFVENTGSSSSPAFGTAQLNPFSLITGGFGPYCIDVVDIDGDDDLDIFYGNLGSNGHSFFENTGTSNSPAFGPTQNNPFNLFGFSVRDMDYVDIDDDGDLDLFYISNYGYVNFRENTGSSTSPAFNFGSFPPAYNIGATAISSGLSFVDIDGDNFIDGFNTDKDKDNTIFFKGIPAVPEIVVEGNNTDIVDGAMLPTIIDDSDFGMVSEASGTISKTFTIKNKGNKVLTLGADAVSLDGLHKDDFTVLSQPSTTVDECSETTFTVGFNPSAAGMRTAEIIIANDDADEMPFNFAIKGAGIPASPTVDNYTYCQDEAANQLTATGMDLLWYAAEVGGMGDMTAPTPITNTAGTQEFWVSQTVAGIESERAKITVTVDNFNTNVATDYVTEDGDPMSGNHITPGT